MKRDPLLRIRLEAQIAHNQAEARVAAAVKKMLDVWMEAVREQVLGRHEDVAALTADAIPLPDPNNVMLTEGVLQDAFQEHVAPVLQAEFGAAFAKSAREALISDQRYREAYAANAFQSFANLPSQMMKDLGAILSNGIGQGASVDQMAADMRKVMSSSMDSAYRYARTSTTDAMAQGVQDGIRARTEAGMTPEKAAWIPIHDSRVRPDHLEAEGQVAGPGEKFHVGGEWLSGPGDPSGSAANVINCRCSLIPVAKGDENVLGIKFTAPDGSDPWGDAVQDDVPDEFNSLPKLAARETYEKAALGANPLAIDTSNAIERYEASQARAYAPYLNNCHQVVDAVEMRARGYDVVAQETIGTVGRSPYGRSADWFDPKTGMPRGPTMSVFSGKSPLEFIQDETESWPSGARGFVSGQWKVGGGGHVFNVAKLPDGTLQFYEGQVKGANPFGYLGKMESDSISIMRVDDLMPDVSILARVKPSGDVAEASLRTQDATAAARLEAIADRRKRLTGLDPQSQKDKATVTQVISAMNWEEKQIVAVLNRLHRRTSKPKV